ncbi:unnamed protein product [Echinostoma caproni]|uniref:Reverse transcriptase domain-containing protein n=1 Tax=Echinostoma caproni TaxID=27848 RepID=A0A183BEQ1_9TREM|nr:unnamed protein product [Echinostoma caproni]
MERVLAKRLREHLLSNDLLCPEQHGFRPQGSCVSNLLLSREQWTSARAAGHETDVIFIEFSKAFDKVPHGRFLEKLMAHGVNDPLPALIEYFLIRRRFTVRVAQTESCRYPVTSGMPQGSEVDFPLEFTPIGSGGGAERGAFQTPSRRALGETMAACTPLSGLISVPAVKRLIRGAAPLPSQHEDKDKDEGAQ